MRFMLITLLPPASACKAAGLASLAGGIPIAEFIHTKITPAVTAAMNKEQKEVAGRLMLAFFFFFFFFFFFNYEDIYLLLFTLRAVAAATASINPARY